MKKAFASALVVIAYVLLMLSVPDCSQGRATDERGEVDIPY